MRNSIFPRLALIASATLCAGVACGGHAAPTVAVSPSSSLVDQPVSIEVRGVTPGALVRLTVREGSWLGQGVFRADAHGEVSPRTRPSLRGTYTGLAPMGLFWSMRGDAGVGDPFFGGTVAVTAVVRGRRIGAGTTIERRAVAPGVTSRPLHVASDGVYGRYFQPAPGSNRHVPVLLFGGSEGGLSMTEEAGLLASHGFPALAIAYFAAPGVPANLERIPIEYFARAARWLGRQRGVDAQRLVVYGVSRGSEAAMLLAAHFPRLVAGVVVLSPSSYAKGAFVPGRIGSFGPGWTFRGRPVPYRSRLHPVAGRIPFQLVRADVFVAAGLEDDLALGYGEEQAIVHALRPIRGRRVVATVYQHAGHFVDTAVPYLPWGASFYNEALGVRQTVGGTTAGDSAARADEWPRIIRFVATTPAARGR